MPSISLRLYENKHPTKRVEFITCTGIVLTPRELVNQSYIAVLSGETSTVDIDDKTKQYLLETGIYAEREGEFLDEHGTRE